MKSPLKAVFGFFLFVACCVAVALLFYLVTRPMAFVTVPHSGVLVSRQFEHEQVPVTVTPEAITVTDITVTDHSHPKRSRSQPKVNADPIPVASICSIQQLRQGVGSVRYCR